MARTPAAGPFLTSPAHGHQAPALLLPSPKRWHRLEFPADRGSGTPRSHEGAGRWSGSGRPPRPGPQSEPPGPSWLASGRRAGGEQLTVRGLAGGQVLPGAHVLDDGAVLVVGAALLPDLHHLHLREGRVPLHNVLWAQGDQAADLQLTPAEPETTPEVSTGGERERESDKPTGQRNRTPQQVRQAAKLQHLKCFREGTSWQHIKSSSSSSRFLKGSSEHLPRQGRESQWRQRQNLPLLALQHPCQKTLGAGGTPGEWLPSACQCLEAPRSQARLRSLTQSSLVQFNPLLARPGTVAENDPSSSTLERKNSDPFQVSPREAEQHSCLWQKLFTWGGGSTQHHRCTARASGHSCSRRGTGRSAAAAAQGWPSPHTEQAEATADPHALEPSHCCQRPTPPPKSRAGTTLHTPGLPAIHWPVERRMSKGGSSGTPGAHRKLSPHRLPQPTPPLLPPSAQRESLPLAPKARAPRAAL